MRISYKGTDEDFKYRLAEISFDDDNENETKLFNTMLKLLEIRGWDVEVVTTCYAIVQVDDYEQYEAFKEDYKEIKHACKEWMRLLKR